MKISGCFFLGAFLFPLFLYAYTPHERAQSEGSIRFSENKGQWNDNVRYRLRFKTGALFLENDRLTYTFIDGEDWGKIHAAHHGEGTEDFQVKGHAFRVLFNGANPDPTTQGTKKYADYENYFIGNDPDKWAGHVNVYEGVKYQHIYQNIDFSIFAYGGNLKYSFVVQPGGDPTNISMTYEGLKEIFLKDNQLHYSTTVNAVREEQLYTYQKIDGQKVEVPCRFGLKENTVSFEFPKGYDTHYPLIIDPVLVFSTFTGSQADNFGFTATYDGSGNFYAGGIARGAGYPATVGAFQANYAGGLIVGNFDLGFDSDISITKFNSSGDALVYSTYIGGSTNEQPQSLIVNSNDELLIYGRTNSANYPVTANAYDNAYNGMMDIIVTKMSADGTSLIGSTFIGGSDHDGTNHSPAPFTMGILKFNYADDARGEIRVDDQDFVYVASCTRSNNFPTTSGVIQSSLSGTQDAVIFKLNRDLSSLVWSTYLGGSGDDAAYSLIFDSQNRIYTCGGTSSTNFPTTSGSLKPNAPGGRADGFVAHINASGTSIIQATYIGTNDYDQAYFVQSDGAGNIYLLGQTSGNYPVSGGVYSNPNSGQFITSITPALNATNFSTVFGRGTGEPDISPTAFLVDNCRNIYVSGWGGATNNGVNAPGNTFNLPVTSDAYQSTTDGSDFYFFVLSKEAASLRYATFFGGPQSHEHVDGGTSRFDKNGVIYQAVCAGCGGFNDFPTTPGVWSNTNQSQNPQRNCNLGAAKFQFELLGVDVSVSASPSITGCVPFTVTLNNNALNAQDFFWDLGDGNTTTDPVPTHTYADTGSYLVTLIGIDSTTCDNQIFSDTSHITIIVEDDSLHTDFVPVIVSNCDSFIVDFFDASFSSNSIDNLLWDFGDGNTSFMNNPSHEYVAAGSYDVTLYMESMASCNPLDTVTKTVVFAPNIEAAIGLQDSFGCSPFTTDFFNNSLGGDQFVWDFDDGNTSSLENPSHIFTDSGSYQISLVIIDSLSCNITDTAYANVHVTDDSTFADFLLDTLSFLCDSMVIDLTNQSIGYTTLHWDFGDGSTSTLENPIYTYTTSDSFEITLVASDLSSCNISDTAKKTIYLPPRVSALFDIPDGCPVYDATISNLSSNALTYRWEFEDRPASMDTVPAYTGLSPGSYSVTLTAYNPSTCNDSAIYTGSFTVFDEPVAYFTTDASGYQLLEEIFFNNQSTNGATFDWDFGDGMVSSEENPLHQYGEVGKFFPCLKVTDINGCDSTYCSELDITFNGLIDVPNAFSPNGDGVNDILYVRGYGVSEIEFRIYNRWGELVFETHDIGIVCNEPSECVPSKGWDGTYKSELQEMDVYVYTLKARLLDGKEVKLRKGNISLIK